MIQQNNDSEENYTNPEDKNDTPKSTTKSDSKNLNKKEEEAIANHYEEDEDKFSPGDDENYDAEEFSTD